MFHGDGSQFIQIFLVIPGGQFDKEREGLCGNLAQRKPGVARRAQWRPSEVGRACAGKAVSSAHSPSFFEPEGEIFAPCPEIFQLYDKRVSVRFVCFSRVFLQILINSNRTDTCGV